MAPKATKICATCGQAGKFDYPPTPGGPEDGVWCQSRAIAEEMQQLENYESDGACIIWRIERVADDVDCPEWIPKIPPEVCGH